MYLHVTSQINEDAHYNVEETHIAGRYGQKGPIGQESTKVTEERWHII